MIVIYIVAVIALLSVVYNVPNISRVSNRPVRVVKRISEWMDETVPQWTFVTSHPNWITFWAAIHITVYFTCHVLFLFGFVVQGHSWNELFIWLVLHALLIIGVCAFQQESLLLSSQLSNTEKRYDIYVDQVTLSTSTTQCEICEVTCLQWLGYLPYHMKSMFSRLVDWITLPSKSEDTVLSSSSIQEEGREENIFTSSTNVTEYENVGDYNVSRHYNNVFHSFGMTIAYFLSCTYTIDSIARSPLWKHESRHISIVLGCTFFAWYSARMSHSIVLVIWIMLIAICFQLPRQMSAYRHPYEQGITCTQVPMWLPVRLGEIPPTFTIPSIPFQ